MKPSVLIGLRFMLSKNTSSYLSLVSRVSVFGLMLGVMALVIVISVMNGFDSQLKYRILGGAPHVILSEPPDPDKNFTATAPFLRYQGMLLSGESRLVSVYGITPELEPQISVLSDHMIEGQISDLNERGHGLIVGASLAARLGLWIGDSTTVMIPVASPGGNGIVPKVARVKIKGLFRIDSELDSSLVLMHVEDLQAVTGAQNLVYRVTLEDIFQVGAVKTKYQDQIISTWAEDYGDFFAAVRMEKLMMFLLLTLIVMIAAFNTVSGLSMMVKEKQGEIAVLRTMGLTPGDVTTVFIVQGSVVGLGGVILGLLLGLPAAYHVSEIVGFVEDLLGQRMLAGTYFDRVPTDVRWMDIIVIAMVSTCIAVLATLYPAYRAGQLRPAEILRAE